MSLTPYPHQILGSQYLLDNNGGAIYSDPRTGKTLMVQIALKKSGKLPALIICPSPVIASWVGALVEDGIDESRIVEFSINKPIRLLKSLLMHKADYFIVNYEKVVQLNILNFRKRLSKIFGLTDWKAIILDESYRIASFTSGISQHVMSLEYDPSQMRVCLTGTPICESPLDAVQPYIFLNGSFFGQTNSFKYRQIYYSEFNYKWKAKSRIHTAKVEKFVRDNSFQVRLKDLGLGGEILYGVELLEMSDQQKRLHQWVALTEHYEIDGDVREMFPAIRSMFWHKISAGIHPITNEIIDLQKADHIANHFLATKDKILVLSRFTKILPSILKVMKSNGIKCEIICGDTPAKERERIRKDFQSGKLDMILAQIDAVARGLDFSNLDKIYVYSNTWGYETRKQVELRGQNVKRSVPYEVTDLGFKGSIETHIRSVMDKKGASVSRYIKEIDHEMLKRWS